ncbi:MAG: GNAT family N-acetyltransferase [Bacteroidia bacterium]|nr:GNAT family N-acetyltransferase [Bacteroidales bacterium]MDD2324052.1 GNAT family N-acetyltransferase [Bacteroidales bacterium]MDD3011899.1 GNAT family N-acetyltransferase [Bacteroidales bacterium]MDY0286299.1 GNAT family N-acetyltransferase [Bacteroidales bacterium]NCD41132.1 GNAT family N-acetyltransferase [Bacteroidia bacterium]
MKTGIIFRDRLFPSDLHILVKIVENTGFFRKDEALVAGELMEENLKFGASSGYQFFVAENAGIPVGFACYGKIPCTKYAYDLYWIAVAKTEQNKGIGKALLNLTEKAVKKQGGTMLYIETSGKKLYENTQKFYSANHYTHLAVFDDFYDIGDSKWVYRKNLD